jgi:carbon starvation protein
VLVVLPKLQMPALTKFIDGSGPVVPGKLFPFCFITIACGAISGFHTIISSGITPKIITRESYARPVGYGAMCLESLVAIMAMIAACTLDPGVYLAMNIKAPGADAAAIATATVTKVNSYGPEFALTAERMTQLAREVKEDTLYGRTGGAATLAVGMANLFSKVVGERWLAIWYHFALMFEALFILTTLDAGTRVGRYLLQDALGHVWKPLGNVRSMSANLFASALVVGAWGYFLVAAVYDPDGGIKALWPIFGIANQLLAATALCLATTVILKMQLGEGSKVQGPKSKVLRHPGLALVTLIPLLWLLTVTGTAAVQKIAHSDSKIGFLAGAKAVATKLDQLHATDPIANSKAIAQLSKQALNLRLDAGVTAFFLALVAAIFLISLREWILLLARKKLAVLRETEPIWLPDYAVAEARPLHAAGVITLSLTLLREISGEAKMDRLQQQCACTEPQRVRLNVSDVPRPACVTREQAYVRAAEERFEGINHCC